MKPAIVIAAFGTSPAALSAYHRIDAAVTARFTDSTIHWCYSARGSRLLDTERYPSPAQVVAKLATAGAPCLVVQYLLLLPGREFHDMQAVFRGGPLPFVPGMPLLTSPADYATVGDLLLPTIAARPDKAILLLGHGTAHPTWTAYCALQSLLRRRFGQRLFVGVIEHYPDSSTLPEEIAAAGYKEVCLIPLLLVTATHFARDMVGDGPTTWTSRLAARGLAVEVIEHGLAGFPGCEALVVSHINQALEQLQGR